MVKRRSVVGLAAVRSLVISAVALGAAALAIWLYFFSGYFEESRLPTVEFSDVAPGGGRNGKDARPELKVAIAAMISPEITKKYYEDLLRVLGDRMGMRVVFIQRRTYAEVNALVEDRGVDFAFVCSGPYVSGRGKFGMEIVAVPVVGGEKYYHSYIIARTGGPIHSLDDLRGKRFAFTDPDSNTGCLVPRYMLAKMGETPESFFSETYYTHSHDNSIRAVAEGRADGAAVDSLIWEFLNSSEPDIAGLTTVVAQSPPYGIPPIVVHPDTDPALKKKLRETLLRLHEDPEGRVLMTRLRIDRFADPDKGAYDEVRRMQEWLAVRGR